MPTLPVLHPGDDLDMSGLWRATLVALVTSAVLGPVILLLLRRLRLVDTPTERSSHDRPTPRGGGLAPALAALAALLAVPVVGGAPRTGLLVAAVGFGLIGAAEDLRGVPPLPRLGWQLAAAGLSLVWLLDGLGGALAWQLVFGAGCLLWLVAYANAFNFMDGINGISAAQTVVAGVAWLAVGRAEGVPALAAGGAVIAGASLAFAPLNYPRAQVFMGDVGSYFIGAWLGALVIVGLRAGVAPEAVLAPVSLYLADTGITIVRRARAAETWYLPHRRHTYQRLTQLGWSHARTTAVVALAMATCSALGAVALLDSTAPRLIADLTLAGVMVGYLASPTLLERGRSTPSPTNA